MGITAADARRYALVKLGRVLRRAGFTQTTSQIIQEHLPPQDDAEPHELELAAVWAQLRVLLRPLGDPNTATETVGVAERLLQAGLFETLLSSTLR